MRRPTSAGRSGTVRSAVAARLGASGPTPRASVSPIPALLRPGARPPCWGSPLLVVAHLSFASLFSRLFLHVTRLSSSANRFPVGVVIRFVRRARPAPGSAHAQSLVLDLNAGRRAGRLRFGVVCVVTLRQQPQATGDQAWDECSESRRRPAFRCRAASVAMFALPRAGVRSSATSPDRRRPVLRRKCPPKSVWGTIRVSRRPVRSDSRSIAASRFFHRRHRPEPGRRRQEERLGQDPDSGHGRSCPGVLPPLEIDRARTPASVRQAPAGRANEHAAPREFNSLPAHSGQRNG